MKRNAALLTAAMATVFVSTTAIAGARVLPHGPIGARPVVSKHVAEPVTTAEATTSSYSPAPAPIVVTRTETEDVIVVVGADGSLVTTPRGAGAAEVESGHEDVSTTLRPPAGPDAGSPATGSSATGSSGAAPPTVATVPETGVSEHPAVSAAPAANQPEPEPNDETRTGGGTGGTGSKGGGLKDHRFDTGAPSTDD